MARFDRLTILNTVLHDGMVPLFYEGNQERTLAERSQVLEFINTTLCR